MSVCIWYTYMYVYANDFVGIGHLKENAKSGNSHKDSLFMCDVACSLLLLLWSKSQLPPDGFQFLIISASTVFYSEILRIIILATLVETGTKSTLISYLYLIFDLLS